MAPTHENPTDDVTTASTTEDELGAPEAVLPASDQEDAEQAAAESAEVSEPAPVPSFGLLFQPPTPVTPPPRRKRATAPVTEPDNAEPDDIHDQERDAQSTSTSDDVESDTDSAHDDGGPRRRRRGGRGRNRGTDAQGNDTDERSSEGDQDESAETSGDESESARDTDSAQESSEDKDSQKSSGRNRGRGKGKGKGKGKQGSGGQAEQESTDDTESDSDEGDDDGDDSGEGAGSSRRRRRRRRGGAGSAGQEDPPGTVTKVRESRRNEPQAIKGSTRLEAKKQRRREGREAGRRRTVITEAEFLARRESVERVMVVRQQGDRTQIGVLEDGLLVEHYVSRETTSTMVGNVYLGRVQNVLPSMEAAFVDIGKGRNAVLYAGEVNWEAQGVGNGQARKIENALSSGDSVLVQVTKDPIGHKGSRLTSQVSLPGRYLVYVPESTMTGISRKLPDTERSRLKSILKQAVPDNAGVIVRTAAEGASEEELTADVERLKKAWEKISAKSESKQGKKNSAGGAPTLLHAEPDMTVRVIRDIFNEDFSKMVVSGDDAWREIKGYVDDVAPDLAGRLEKWTGQGDVFAEHRIDESIAKAMDRKVWLPSGGSLVIDRTEAMTVVDVNTGKFTGSGGNLEETVTKNNLEAAEEIVRQLRLRDIGGIIVVDFIDMVLESNRDLVVRRLLECLGRDRTKHQVAEVTSLGLVQMTRKRVGSGLIEVFSESCEHCSGRGIVVHSEPIAHDPGNHSGGNHGGGGKDSGRSRKGRGKSGTQDTASQGSSAEEETDANGRTAAQIAAAAHAAAIKSIVGEGGSEDHAEAKGEAPAETQERSEPTPAPAKKGGRGKKGTPRASAEPAPAEPSPPEPSAPEPVPASTPEATQPAGDAPPRRRGGRRAASSAGAPVALQPVDLTAPAPTSSAPLTAIAGESGAAPTTPVADAPEPAVAPRRKRKRVVAQAGPPKPEDEAGA